MHESEKSVQKAFNPVTYSHDMKEYSSHIVTMTFRGIMGVRMVMQIRALLHRAVELVIVVIVTELIARCYWRWDRILLRTSANSIQHRVVWVTAV